MTAATRPAPGPATLTARAGTITALRHGTGSRHPVTVLADQRNVRPDETFVRMNGAVWAVATSDLSPA